ncbi:LCP family protein [Paenibacillus senegalensis]|uniref:LCP family protein n=1 Tax=Paenibacillus senegalensis TaxID=1465766 RepID=UPI000288E991|nr:LCP family protein [Paenibacillus senegalensis]
MRKKIKWIVLTLTVLILGTVFYFGYHIFTFAGDIYVGDDPDDHKFFSPANPTENPPPPKWEGTERVNILLLGADARDDGAPGRADTIMVASIDPVSKNTYLFSILRDTYVEIGNRGKDRINAALVYGGPNLAMRTVSELMGIPIQYYIYTDFRGFEALVDSVNGVEIDVEKDMYYYDSYDDYEINLKEGLQVLDGEKALQYVRFRHDKLGDYTRTERQRNLLNALAQKMQKTTSLIRLPSILQSVEPYIETNISRNNLIKLAALGFEAKTSDMVTEQIPPMSLLRETTINGAQVILADEDDLHQYIEELFIQHEQEPEEDTEPEPNSIPGSSSSTPNPNNQPSAR